MPDIAAHEAAARRHHAALAFLLPQIDVHAEWVVITAFYKALHRIELAFAADTDGEMHFFDHRERNSFLKDRRNRRYANLGKHYRPLFDASLVARYVQPHPGSPIYSTFLECYPATVIKTQLIDHRLRQIQSIVETLVGRQFNF